MAVYRFRVCFEDDDDVYREIDIRSNQTFEDLHRAIQSAIKFDDSQVAVFYHTDSNWRKEDEIVQVDKKADSKSKKLKIASFVEDPHQRFLYLFDLKEKWVFYVEMIKILQEQAGVEYPKCTKVNGSAPLQYRPVLTPAVGSNADEDEDDSGELEPTNEELVYETDESLSEESTEKETTEEGGEDKEGEESSEDDENEEGQENDEFSYGSENEDN